MEELIKEAERLRVKLLEVVLHIPYDFDPDDTIALSQTTDILKQLYGRKDNIVDLGKVWHGVDEEPICGKKLLQDNNRLGWSIRAWNGMFPWRKHVELYGFTKWAYLKDLLPKGNVE